jgi:hypothetical protein
MGEGYLHRREARPSPKIVAKRSHARGIQTAREQAVGEQAMRRPDASREGSGLDGRLQIDWGSSTLKVGPQRAQ